MKFLLDSNIPNKVSRILNGLNYHSVRVNDIESNMDDISILNYACQNDYILITKDSDFFYLVFDGNHKHKGVVWFRLKDQKVEVLEKRLKSLMDEDVELSKQFVTVYDDEIVIE